MLRRRPLGDRHRSAAARKAEHLYGRVPTTVLAGVSLVEGYSLVVRAAMLDENIASLAKMLHIEVLPDHCDDCFGAVGSRGLQRGDA